MYEQTPGTLKRFGWTDHEYYVHASRLKFKLSTDGDKPELKENEVRHSARRPVCDKNRRWELSDGAYRRINDFDFAAAGLFAA